MSGKMSTNDRVTRWSNLLDLDSQPTNILEDFSLNHPQQASIHAGAIYADCLSLQRRLHIFEENELQSTLELLLTIYCKTEGVPYKSGMHELLAPFFLMGFQNFKTVFLSFRAFVQRFVPRVFQPNSSLTLTCQAFHKLLLYHEPVLCSALDARMQVPSSYAERWFVTLFANSLDVSLLLAFWEFCLQEDNPTLPYFFGLVVVSRSRAQVLSKKKTEFLDFKVDNIKELDDMCQEALVYQQDTPQSFVDMLSEAATQEHAPTHLTQMYLSSRLALPILPPDLISKNPCYFVIDIRPSEEFCTGHYPNSYNLSSDLHTSTGTALHRQRRRGTSYQGFPPTSPAALARPVTSHFAQDTDVLKSIMLRRCALTSSGEGSKELASWKEATCFLRKPMILTLARAASSTATFISQQGSKVKSPGTSAS
jgi:hypothetical protein